MQAVTSSLLKLFTEENKIQVRGNFEGTETPVQKATGVHGRSITFVINFPHYISSICT